MLELSTYLDPPNNVKGRRKISRSPCVSIGMPVYNGENYLEEAINSILGQTFTDFELIISDNASTDRTEEICSIYASRDSRIRYYRNEENLGASANYNRVFELANGKYFKWMAHDDLCAPEFLEKCVKVLDQDPAVILAFTGTKEIDETGIVIGEYAPKPNLGAGTPHERFYESVCLPNSCTSVFGLVRSDVLRRTRLIGNYVSSDRPLLGELSLRGRFYEIPEYLFFKRVHPEAHWKVYSTRHLRQRWYDPNKVTKLTFPHWRLLWEHLFSIKRVRLSRSERIWCNLTMLWWIRKHWRYLARNLILQEPRLSQ